MLSGQDKVTITNGTHATVVGKGFLRLSNQFTLSFTLHLPSISINLVSVSSLTKQLHCSVTFLLLIIVYFRIFQQGKRLGLAVKYMIFTSSNHVRGVNSHQHLPA